MCTVTILRQTDGLLVTMNRDEAAHRGPEVPPRRQPTGTPGAPTWWAPADSDSGGTWMGVNGLGWVACLLNRYAPEDTDPARLLPGQRSRGEIIPGVLAHRTETDALTWLREGLSPALYGSFTLVLALPSATHTFEWAYGEGLQESNLDGEWTMLTSSAFDTAAVLEWRRHRFEAWQQAGCRFEETVPAIHLDRPADEEHRAILMDRGISATRSITQVDSRETGHHAVMRYWPRAAGQTRLDSPSVLPLQLALPS